MPYLKIKKQTQFTNWFKRPRKKNQIWNWWIWTRREWFQFWLLENRTKQFTKNIIKTFSFWSHSKPHSKTNFIVKLWRREDNFCFLKRLSAHLHRVDAQTESKLKKYFAQRNIQSTRFLMKLKHSPAHENLINLKKLWIFTILWKSIKLNEKKSYEERIDLLIYNSRRSRTALFSVNMTEKRVIEPRWNHFCKRIFPDKKISTESLSKMFQR